MEDFKDSRFQEALLRGNPGRIGENAVAWDRPNQ